MNLGPSYPSGLSPCESEWKELIQCCIERHHILCLVASFPELASSNNYDIVRYCLSSGVPCLLILDLQTMFGLYGRNVGCVVLVGQEVAQHQDALNGEPLGCIQDLRICSQLLGTPKIVKQW